ncbi:hypothetical protein V6B16_01640 [Salinimicrobium catena]|uniref:hypothetical protein n=1 Tax=Salinimicrobium catena TaxID=390640 RepID=UPI002FE4E7DE
MLIQKINFILTKIFLLIFEPTRVGYFKYLFFKNVQKTGEGVKITGKIKVINNAGLTVGSNVYFGEDVEMRCHGGVIIGNDVIIEDDCRIISSYPVVRNNYDSTFISELPGSIIIGDNVLIGKGSIIRSEVEIPSNTVIPPYSFIGTPADLSRTTATAQNFHGAKRQEYDRVSVIEKYEEFPDEVVFVFSTGRSGSNAIETLANKNPRINAFHEPFYAQIKILAFNYSAGFISEEEAKNNLIKIYLSAPISQRKKIYLESDQKLVPFIKIISSLFPKAKFIWLIRSPGSFLKSAKARGWFLNDYPTVLNNQVLITPEMMSDACRLTGDFTDEFTKEEWLSLSHDDKILWYWFYWNKLIEHQLRSVSNKKYLLKLEDINTNAKSFFEFVSNEFNSDWKPEVTNKVKKKHQKKYSSVTNNKVNYYDLEKLKDYYSSLDENIFSLERINE